MIKRKTLLPGGNPMDKLVELRNMRDEAKRSDNLDLYLDLKIKCERLRKKLWVINNPEKRKEALLAYYRNNKNKIKLYYESNKVGIINKGCVYQKNNKEKVNFNNRKYKRKNVDKIRALNAKRRAGKLNRTPSWLTLEDLRTIRLFYKKAYELTLSTGILHHVDHIIPLLGKTVSGLHVPSNLQILRYDENCRKSNKFVPGQLSQ